MSKDSKDTTIEIVLNNTDKYYVILHGYKEPMIKISLNKTDTHFNNM